MSDREEPPSPSRRRALRTLLALGASVGAAFVPAVAQGEARLELSAEPANPSAGEPFRIRYGVQLINEQPPRIPALDFGGLEVLSDPSPPQMPTMFGFGFGGNVALSMQTASDYIVRAPRAGRFVVSNARVLDARGRVLAQHANLVVVVGASSAPAPGADPAGQTPEPQGPRDPDAPPEGPLTGANPGGAAFVRVALDPPSPWLGQQATLRAWLYVNAAEAGCEVTSEPGLTGFFNESLSSPRRDCASAWFRTRVPGQNAMQAGLLRRIALFPTQTGALTVTPMTVEAQLVTGGFFRSVQRVTAQSPTLEVVVREPPLAGRPEGYVPGVVGPLRLEANVDRAQVSVGETATVTLTAVSDGSLASAQVALPSHVDGLRLRSGGTRASRDTNLGHVVNTLVTELLVVPERAGRFTLGEVSLPYWDAAQERYGIARVSLPVLEARGEALAAERGDATEDPAMTLRPLVAEPQLRPGPSRALRGRAALAWIGALPLGALLTAGGRAARRSLAARKRERAEQEQSDPAALLAEARRALAEDKPRALALAARALDRSSAEARAGLEDGLDSLPAEAREALQGARSRCDDARFSGASTDAEAVLSAVEKAVQALTEALER